MAPSKIGRSTGVGITLKAPVTVHIGRHQRERLRQVLLAATDEMQEAFTDCATGIAEDVLTALDVHNTLVHMHGRAGLVAHWLRHKRCEHFMVQCGFANDALEVEDLVCEQDRITVREVDLNLAGTVFLDNRLNSKTSILRKIVNGIDDRAVVVHR